MPTVAGVGVALLLPLEVVVVVLVLVLAVLACAVARAVVQSWLELVEVPEVLVEVPEVEVPLLVPAAGLAADPESPPPPPQPAMTEATSVIETTEARVRS
ncbi:hypothetical protein Bpla01_01310 [Burkholderia plantarii]|nr:hypothetical protein Bpla01_01310 [Burkholderia plantarii]